MLQPRSNRRLLGAAILAASAAFAAPRAQAQVLSAPAGTSGFASYALPDGLVHVSDVFIGRGTVGPYLLTWKGIAQGTAVVSRGATRQVEGTDYSLDIANGVLTFTSALKDKEIARVDYAYAPGNAKQNSQPALSPVQLDLLSQYNGSLKLSAVYRPDPNALTSGTTASPGVMLLSLNGNAKLNAGSTLVSKIFLDGRGGNVLDRSGIQLNEKTKAAFGQLAFNFTRAGAGFTGGSEAGLTAAQQVMDGSATLNPILGVRASATFRQTTDLTPDAGGATTTAFGQRLQGTIGGNGLRFQASRTETAITQQGTDAVYKTASRLQLDQTLGAVTQATLLFDMNDTSSAGDHAITQSSTLTVRSQPTDKVTVSGTLSNKLLTTGAEDSTSLTVEAQAAKQVKLSAAIGEKYNQSGALHQRQAALDYVANKNLTLTGSLQLKADSATESYAGGLSATARPNRYMQVAGGFKMRDSMVNGVPDPTTPNTYDLRLSLGLPSKAITLTGAFARNPEDDAGSVAHARSQAINLQSVLGQFDLAGAYSQETEDITEHMSQTVELKLGWRFARATQLLTSYKNLQTVDGTLSATDTYGLTLTHNLGSRLNVSLSGLMTTYYKDGLWQPDADYAAQARLGMKF